MGIIDKRKPMKTTNNTNSASNANNIKKIPLIALALIIMLIMFVYASIVGVEPKIKFTSHAYTASELEVGDYFTMGKMNRTDDSQEADIEWRVISKSGNDILVRANKSVGNRAFSRNGSTNSYGVTYRNVDSNRTNYGTNLWHESDMRYWLNGYPAVNGVTTPTSFWSNFSDEEKGFIELKTQTQYLAQIDSSSSADKTDLTNFQGTTAFPYDGAINGAPNILNPSALTSANDYYRYTMSDKVFLLDNYQNYLLSTTALKNASGGAYHILLTSSNQVSYSWTRSPYAAISCSVRFVYTDGSLYYNYASTT
jgi:hypothetical protein